MNTRARITGILAVGLLIWGVSAASAQSMDAQTLLAKMDSILYPDSFHMKAVMATHRPDRRDTAMTMESYYKQDVGTLIEILDPPRSRGTKFLQKEGSLWMYNPKSNSSRAIRLSPRDSFQGSVFSNNDIGDPKYANDYRASFGDDETIQNKDLGSVECRTLIGEPKGPTAAYGKIKVWLRKSDNMPLRMDYYAKSGLLFKRLILTSFKQLAGEQRPSMWRMDSLEQKDAYSTVEIQQLEARNNLPDRMFTEANLTR